ncbi:hypothetical protein [Streptomyces sp. DH37]|uniref:hypothetical protein n=1 Tax=Streptomyces sp. DH37 TaxID=3040122 RepID=UPI0024434D97|nr:hypothetical protein [Streptomyces sp. DH37]MDG9701698.1 hypothetical protein [Streptomyces sp. DH37]
MTDDPDDEHVPSPAAGLPIVTADDGQPYLPAAAVIAYLRAVADSCRNLADDPECGPETAAEAFEATAGAIGQEADALECAAIARTRPG